MDEVFNWICAIIGLLLTLPIIFATVISPILEHSRKIKKLSEDLLDAKLNDEKNNQTIKELRKENERLSKNQNLYLECVDKSKQLKHENEELQKQNESLSKFRNLSLECIDNINQQFKTQYDTYSFFDAITENRLNNALKTKLDINTLSAEIYSENSQVPYKVSLSSCTCPDYSGRNNYKKSTPFPCKHMLYLAYTLNLLQQCQKEESYAKNVMLLNLNKMSLDTKKAKNQRDNIRNDIAELKKQLKHENEELEKTKQELQIIIDNGRASYPHLAHLIAEVQTLHYERAAQYLEEKDRPALVEAKRIRELRDETIDIKAKLKEKEEQLKYLKRLFPNIDIVLEDDFEPSKWFHIEYSDDFKK